MSKLLLFFTILATALLLPLGSHAQAVIAGQPCGTATSCADLTHLVAFNQGDLISIQFTTQAADTLAGVKAVVATE